MILIHFFLISDSFTFSTECKSDGILVSVEAQFDYDGAIYGLYDYFTCRYEPKKERKFSFFFPLPKLSKNCSASMYYQVIQTAFLDFFSYDNK